MTEYNIFCYSKQYNKKDSFQQNRYRAFNKEVGEKRYNEILRTVRNILGKPDLKLQDFWKQVTQDQWNQLFEIPEARDFKVGFSFISGVNLATLADVRVGLDRAMIMKHLAKESEIITKEG